MIALLLRKDQLTTDHLSLDHWNHRCLSKNNGLYNTKICIFHLYHSYWKIVEGISVVSYIVISLWQRVSCTFMYNMYTVHSCDFSKPATLLGENKAFHFTIHIISFFFLSSLFSSSFSLFFYCATYYSVYHLFYQVAALSCC